MKLISIFTSIALTVTPLNLTIADDNIPEDYPKLLPKLLINEEPELCKVVLQVAHDAYLSQDQEQNYFNSTRADYYKRMKSVPNFEDWHDLKTIQFHRMRYSIGGVGYENWASPIKTEAMPLRYLISFSKEQYLYPTSFLRIVTFDNEPTLVDGHTDLSNYNEEPSPKLPSTIEISRRFPFVPIRFKGRNYIVSSTKYAWGLIDSLLVDEIDGKRICETRLLDTPLYRAPMADRFMGFEKTIPSLHEFIKASDQVAGVNERGGRNVNNSHKIHSSKLILTALYRPWALKFDPKNKGEFIDNDILSTWKYTGPWEYRQFNNYKRLYSKLISDVTEYFVRHHGWELSAAEHITKQTINQFQKTLYGRGDYLRNYLINNNVLEAPEFHIRRLLLQNSPAESITSYLDQHPELQLGNVRLKCVSITICEPIIFYALESQKNIGLSILLERGVNANTTNRFGKTPLMFAAHMNNIDAVLHLLTAGANINDKTDTPTDRFTVNDIHYHARTALMYAAENADLGLIKLLLDHGADPTLKDADSQRGNKPARSVLDYLALNETLSDEEMVEAKTMLTDAIEGWGQEGEAR